MARAPGGPRRAPVKDEEEGIPPPHAHAQEQAWGARASRRGRHAPARRSERALVRDAQAGSAEAFEELFRRHWPRAHRTAYLIVGDAAAAEDIAQEAFLAAVRALDRFDRRRPLGPWLSRIVANRAIDWARARAVRREVDARRVPEAVAGPGDPTRPWSDAVVAALGELSPEHRAVIVLRHLLEYTPGEIARALELPRGTVNSRLRRGLDGLEAALREEREEQ
jgi:RNA polymerase sigma-70 factor (ECF subfamily)